MLTEASKRDTILHVHISDENKKWLMVLSDKLNRPMGDLVDEILSHTREDAKKEKKLR